MLEALTDLRRALEMEIALAPGLVVLPDETASVAPQIVASATVATETPAPAVVQADQVPPIPDTEGSPVFREPVQVLHSVRERDPYARIQALIPEDSPLHRMQSLEEVERYVAENQLIPLDATRTNPVFGSGNPNADVMVIGEAPGADEDRQGLPFVGRAGQLLTDILKAIQFSRDDVYIANILKSRPPNNREPQPDEIAGHIPVLYRQMTLIRPRVLLCLGRTSGNGILRAQSSLAAMRGEIKDFCGLPVVVTYHPAALLRNPQWKYPTWDDVRMLRKFYDELPKPQEHAND